MRVSEKNALARYRSFLHRLLHRLEHRLSAALDLKPGEMPALCWSFTFFFCLLSGYYVIRPLRDEMGIAGGVEQLQWLFSGTFLLMLAAAPLYGWLTSRFQRRQFLPYLYYFFIINLLLFYLLFQWEAFYTWTARAFFIWTSVFNLFIVSVFWSYMADLFSNEQGKRLFGVIAAGGSLGALIGPVLTGLLVIPLGPVRLLLVSALLLALSLLCIHQLNRWQLAQLSKARTDTLQAMPVDEPRIGGHLLAGFQLIKESRYLQGIALLILLYATLSTFLYFQQATIVRDAFADPAHRTLVFAGMDFAVNALTLSCQLLFTGRIVKRWGLALTLALIPVLLGVGFVILGLFSALTTIVVLQVLRRAGNYALMKPAREMLFLVVPREAKYKAKSVLDTVVYRGGDAISAWLYSGLSLLGLGLSGIAFLAVPLCGVWALIGRRLGQQQERLAVELQSNNLMRGESNETHY